MKAATTAVMFGQATDQWSTPPAFFAELDAEFDFAVDAAADATNAKCRVWFGERIDALALESWASTPCSIFVNPPYSRCAEFVAKAAEEAAKGCTVVMLIPSRTDTRYWHAHIWDREKHQPKPGVEVRFVKGRLKFGGGKNVAPFPSVVVVFRPAGHGI